MNDQHIGHVPGSMSLRQKIGQTSQERLSDVLNWCQDDLSSFLEQYPLGSIFVGNEVISSSDQPMSSMRDQIARCQEISAVPLSVAGDLENGAGGAIRGMTAFPHLMCLGATDNEELAYEYGRLTAEEAVQVGFNWVFGPVADLSMNWLNPIVGTRCLGGDHRRTTRLLRALIQGYQDHGLSATAKHFPGDGVDFRDQHLITSVNALHEDAWRKTFGEVFGHAFGSQVHSVMAGHIALPWCDSETDRTGRPAPATVSKSILTDLLRSQMGFDGVAVSDALIMAGFSAWLDYESRIVDAFNAGIDVMLWPGRSYFDIMTRAVEDGRVSEARLDEAVERILQLKQKQKLFEKTDRSSAVEQPAPVPAAYELAQRVAARGATLVRNRRAQLPLDSTATNRVLLLYATTRPERAESDMMPLREAMAARRIDVTLHVNGNCLDIWEMEAQGERYDALICLFNIQTHDMKNSFRPTGAMAECIWTLQNTNTMEPIIVSLSTPYLLHDMPFADTLINLYSSSYASLDLLSHAIFGEIPFTGTSPVNVGGDWIERPMLDYLTEQQTS